jgi:hypothetical protein
MVTKEEILMGRQEEFPLDEKMSANIDRLFLAVNRLREMYNKPMYVSSGYRPDHYNVEAGGAANSPHLTCQAVDFHDVDGEIKKFCTIEVLEECGLFMESPDHTPTWCHVQVRPTKNRIFIP